MRRARDPRLRIDPLRVDRHAGDAHAGGGKRDPGHRIAGVLDPHRIAGFEHRADDEVQRLLRARGQHHLIGRAVHAARGSEIGGDFLAQFGRAGRLGIVKMAGRRQHQMSVQQGAEDLDGAGIGRRAAERARQRTGFLARIARHRRLRRSACRHGGRHIGARPDAGLGKAVGHQHLVGGNRRTARQAEACGEIPRRRQLGARRQRAALDQPAQLAIERQAPRPGLRQHRHRA
ncbi:hypothetical protein D3C72_1329080 [compost metagenome]